MRELHEEIANILPCTPLIDPLEILSYKDIRSACNDFGKQFWNLFMMIILQPCILSNYFKHKRHIIGFSLELNLRLYYWCLFVQERTVFWQLLSSLSNCFQTPQIHKLPETIIESVDQFMNIKNMKYKLMWNIWNDHVLVLRSILGNCMCMTLSFLFYDLQWWYNCSLVHMSLYCCQK